MPLLVAISLGAMVLYVGDHILWKVLKRAIRRTVVMLVCALALVYAFLLVGDQTGYAQELDPYYAVPSYTTADPIDPSRFGLATPDGRFALTPMSGCDWLVDPNTGSIDQLQQVNLYPNAFMQPVLGLSSFDQAQPTCLAQLNGRMSTVPCFSNPDGTCNAALEQP